MNEQYYTLSEQEIEKQFQTNSEEGLTSEEAAKRLKQNGFNEFEKKKKRNILLKFLDQFKSFMILVLVAAAVVSGVIGYINGEGFTDTIIILVIVVLNAIIGVAQEAKAEQSLEALEKLSAPHCRVIRDGQTKVIASRELVVGDVVIIETGDSVPADIRLAQAVNLKIQEAALTGESVPVEKSLDMVGADAPIGDRVNMAFASCSVTYGRGKGVVVATGVSTEVGKIAAMLQAVPDMQTPLQKKLDKLGKGLAIAALAICAVIFIIGVIYGNPILDMFMTAVSLAAAAIPEGLPAVSTILLAVGVQRLAKRNAIVRNLPSVETLGSVTVICSDKTGTLTQNRMTVVKTYTDGKMQDVGYNSETISEMCVAAILANDGKLVKDGVALKGVGDPTETALLDLGLKYNLSKETLEQMLERVGEVPFDSERKRMSVISRDKQGGGLTVSVKGGLDEVLICCTKILDSGVVRPMTLIDREQLNIANLDMAREALRVLAVAVKEIPEMPAEINAATVEHDLVFLGMVGMIDPPRDEVRVAVQECKLAGIKPVMITGDHKITATAIASSLGIMDDKSSVALSGADVEKMSDEELKSKVPYVSLFARVSPEHKVRIVKAFQENSNVVAMTGDGVNDAPALKLADIGVAMGITGTDVSKEAADVVLTDDNFATIVTSVSEGRRIYDNIIKAVQFMLSTNIGEILVLLVAVLANWVAPLIPIQILWINLVTDSLPALALSMDPAEGDVMRRKPLDPRRGIITWRFSFTILIQGMLVCALSLLAYKIGLAQDIATARTMTFATLAFSQMSIIFSIRSKRESAFKGFFSNLYLVGATIIVMGLMLVVLLVPTLQGLFQVVPLSAIQWILVVLLSLGALLISDLAKLIIRAVRK